MPKLSELLHKYSDDPRIYLFFLYVWGKSRDIPSAVTLYLTTDNMAYSCADGRPYALKER